MARGRQSVNTAHYSRNSTIDVQARRVDNDQLTSRRSSLALWRTDPVPGRKSMIGDPLPEAWSKATTEDGTPYYVNHITRQTQWADPRLEDCMKELAIHDDVRLAAYRAALKIRDLQVYTRLSRVTLGNVLNSFYALDIGLQNDESLTVSAHEMATVLLELFADLPYPQSTVEILVSWMLKAYDRQKTGRVGLQALKTALTVLAIGWIEEKYRMLFAIYDTNEDHYISGQQLSAMIKHSLALLETFREAFPFGPGNDAIENTVRHVLQLEQAASGGAGQQVSLTMFVTWALEEPRPFVWIPTMHRIAATENSKHESVCCVCKMYPIIGFRYKNMSCMDRDVCQECFWTGKEGNGHKNSHELREYCFASTAREDTKDFFGRIKRKFQRKKKLQAEDSAFGPLALPGPSGQPVSTRADVGVDAAKTRGEDLDTIHLEGSSVNALNEEHDMIASMAQRLTTNDEGGPVSTMVVSLETEQKLHLLRVIDELDAENRTLLRQLTQSQQTEFSPQENERGGDDEELHGRIHDLNSRNQDLHDQLARLQALLEASGMAAGKHMSSETDFAAEYDHRSFENLSEEPLPEYDHDVSYVDTSAQDELAQLDTGLCAAFEELHLQAADIARLRNDFFTQALEAASKLDLSLCDVVEDMQHGQRRSPRSSQTQLTPERRRDLWGVNVDLLEEQERLGKSPMPRASIRRHHGNIKRASIKNRAALVRLNQYAPETDLVTPFTPMATPTKSRLMSSEGVQTDASSRSMQDAGTDMEDFPEIKETAEIAVGGEDPIDLSEASSGDAPPPAPPTSAPPAIQEPSQSHVAPVSASPGDDEDDEDEEDLTALPMSARNLQMSGKPATTRHLPMGQPTGEHGQKAIHEMDDLVSEIQQHARNLRSHHQPVAERITVRSDHFNARLLDIRHRYEATTGLDLRGVTADNAERTVLKLFGDGYLFCILANVSLRRRKLLLTKPNRSTLNAAMSHRTTNLTNLEVAHNFEVFGPAWTQLGLHPADIPTVKDFRALEKELTKAPEERKKSLKVLHAIEALLEKAGESVA